MSKFQAQKQKIKRQFLHYPRCVRSPRETHRLKQRASWVPGNKFYSWKNYLNAEVDKYYNVIMHRNNNSSTYSQPLIAQHEGIERFRRACQSNDNSYSDNINIKDQKQNQKQEIRCSQVGNFQGGKQKTKKKYQNLNTNILYSKEQIGTNTTIKTFQKHKHSSSVITSQIQKQGINSEDGGDYRVGQLQRKRQKSIISLQIQREANKMGQNNGVQKRGLNLSKQVQLQISNLKNEKKEQKVEHENIGLDNYHLQLKLKERQYLLTKFMNHYEQIHHQIL